MRILINAIPLLSPLTGVARYTYHLAKALKEVAPTFEYYYFYGYFSRELRKPEPKTFDLFNSLKNLLRRTPLSSLLRQLKHRLASFSNLETTFDVYLEPNFIPLRTLKAKKILTVVHDFSFHFYPQWHPQDRVSYFKEFFWKEIHRSDYIIFDSETILKEALELGFPQEKLLLLYPGIDHSLFKPLSASLLEAFRKKLKLPEKFLLFVGALEPRKNLSFLFKTYNLLPSSLRKEFPLLVVGSTGWGNQDYLKELKHSKVLFLGYVRDEVLAKLYNLATLLIYPSLYEGFGFPPLEAMACGCPALVSELPVFREVYGEAVFYFQGKSPEEFASTLRELLQDEEKLREKGKLGLSQASLYCWKKTAKLLLSKVFQVELDRGSREFSL